MIWYFFKYSKLMALLLISTWHQCRGVETSNLQWLGWGGDLSILGENLLIFSKNFLNTLVKASMKQRWGKKERRGGWGKNDDIKKKLLGAFRGTCRGTLQGTQWLMVAHCCVNMCLKCLCPCLINGAVQAGREWEVWCCNSQYCYWWGSATVRRLYIVITNKKA